MSVPETVPTTVKVKVPPRPTQVYISHTVFRVWTANDPAEKARFQGAFMETRANFLN